MIYRYGDAPLTELDGSDVLILSAAQLAEYSAISPSDEAYTCLAVKKVYTSTRIRKIIVTFDNETVVFNGMTATYFDGGDGSLIAELARKLSDGEDIAQ